MLPCRCDSAKAAVFKASRFQSSVHLFINTAGTHFREANHSWRRTCEDSFSKCTDRMHQWSFLRCFL